MYWNFGRLLQSCPGSNRLGPAQPRAASARWLVVCAPPEFRLASRRALRTFNTLNTPQHAFTRQIHETDTSCLIDGRIILALLQQPSTIVIPSLLGCRRSRYTPTYRGSCKHIRLGICVSASLAPLLFCCQPTCSAIRFAKKLSGASRLPYSTQAFDTVYPVLSKSRLWTQRLQHHHSHTNFGSTSRAIADFAKANDPLRNTASICISNCITPYQSI